MSKPSGEFPLPQPTYSLMQPTEAPAELLAGVHINKAGQLESNTPLGPIAVQLVVRKDPQFIAKAFFPALDPNMDPSAFSNPIATRRYPYAILPDKTNYEVWVYAPLDATRQPWSDEHIGYSGKANEAFTKGGISEYGIKALPNIDIDRLRTSDEPVVITQQAKPEINVLPRVEDGEPLGRFLSIDSNNSSVNYKEAYAGNFDTRTASDSSRIINRIPGQVTVIEGGEASLKPLEFRTHTVSLDAPEVVAKETDGLFEVIVVESTKVNYTNVLFDLPSSDIVTSSLAPFYEHSHTPWERQADGKLVAPSGLQGGETQFLPGKAVEAKVIKAPIINRRPIAAFRFALAGLFA